MVERCNGWAGAGERTYSPGVQRSGVACLPQLVAEPAVYGWTRFEGVERAVLVHSPLAHPAVPPPTWQNNRVVKHIEAWDVDPARVVRSLLKPSAKVGRPPALGRQPNCCAGASCSYACLACPSMHACSAFLRVFCLRAVAAPHACHGALLIFCGRSSCSPQVPTTFSEVLCQSLHDGDLPGVWFCFSSGIVKSAGAASIALLLLHILRWAGAVWLKLQRVAARPRGAQVQHASLTIWLQTLPSALAAARCRGEGFGGWEAAAYLGFVAGLGTEMYKIVRSIGGESG